MLPQLTMISRPPEASGSLVYKWSEGPLTPYGQVTVDADEVAVCFATGQVVGVIGPGRYSLDPSSMPFLTSAGGPPFPIELFFVTTRPLPNLAFGGVGPTLIEPVCQISVQPRILGTYALRVTDPPRFVAGLASGGGDEAALLKYFSERVLLASTTALESAVASGQVSLATAGTIGPAIAPAILAAGAELASYGVELVEVANVQVTLSDGDQQQMASMMGALAAARAPAGPAPEAEKVYEMLWDCKYCGTRKNLGLSHRCCPNCGAAQDPTARYFPADNEKVAVQDHPYAGADAVCPACRETNGAACKCCRNCGSPMDGSKAVATRADQVHALGAFAGDSAQAARAEFYGGAPPPPAVPPPPEKKTNWLAWVGGIGCLGVVVIAVLVALVMFFTKREAALEVTGHSWERSIEIESYGKVRESDWCSNMPSGAREVSRTKAERSTRKVQDGEECKTRKKDRGDGTFKETKECTPKYREEPVMDDKCSYDVTKWSRSRTETAKGSSTTEPRAWPPTNLTRTGTCEGCEREGKRSEVYKVTFREPPKTETYECGFPEAKWASYQKGSKWKGGIRSLGGLDCGSLVPAK
jgi:membrane protease subunit (stomatin/prohibitin family)